MPGWFTDKKGNKINTDNDSSGIKSGQFHDKGSDVIEELIHNKDSETEGMKGNRENPMIRIDSKVELIKKGKEYEEIIISPLYNDESKFIVNMSNEKGHIISTDVFDSHEKALDFANYKSLKSKAFRSRDEDMNKDEYERSKTLWDNLTETSKRVLLSTVSGKDPEKIKFVNYNFNDLSTRDQNACLSLVKSGKTW